VADPITHRCPRCLAGPHKPCLRLRAGSYHFARVRAAKQPPRPSPDRCKVPPTERAYQSIRAEADRRRVPMAWVLEERIATLPKEQA
jgi:hypothetical protein